MAKKPKQKAKTNQSPNQWKRLKFSEFTHWASRHKLDTLPPVKAKVLSVAGETVEEAIAISIALELLTAVSTNSTLQSAFNKECESVLAQLNKDFPNYKYSLGGRGKGKAKEAEEAPAKPKKKKAKAKNAA